MTIFIHYMYIQGKGVARWRSLYRGPPPASMPEARGDSGEEGDVSGEAGWLEKECERQPVR